MPTGAQSFNRLAVATGTKDRDTPAWRQYVSAKAEHPDCVVLFRLGDFFEIFGDDAVEVAPLLGLTLTGRDFGRGGRVPMCGVPRQSLETYASRLLQAGKRIAVCDQVEAARPGGKLVDRRVVRVLTAGTVVEDSLLDPKTPRRCAGVFHVEDGVGLAMVDFSSGECILSFRAGARAQAINSILAAWDVAEAVVVAEAGDLSEAAPGVAITTRAHESFDIQLGLSLIRAGGLEMPIGQPIALAEAAARALAGVASHGSAGLLALDSGLLRPRWILPGEVMELDAATRRSLELTKPASGDGSSLLRIVDRTRTAPGARLLRGWIQSPLVDLALIQVRQGAVRELSEKRRLASELRTVLQECRDVERLVGRAVHRVAGPRDLQQLARTVQRLPVLGAQLGEASSDLLVELASELAQAPLEMAAILESALCDETPVTAKDGGFVRAGFDEELDLIKEGAGEARAYIAGLEEQERQRTGLKGLKVGYNRVFGYYIELRGALDRPVPEDYIPRQTLVGAQRYITAQLRSQEAVVLTARDRAVAREQSILDQLLSLVSQHARVVGRGAVAMASLDSLLSLAEVGTDLGWVLPRIDSSRALEIIEGRHPLVEEAVGPGRFVPNDIRMDGETERIWLITGPNMAGKSTFLRQVALICLLGQVGAPVPCRSARWGLVDRIFTRVGAQDDLSGGRSTFMVEMTEVAEILAHATPRSLLVLDEVGRGTSTYDGISLAQALLEHLHDNPRVAARVLFSTHYHELTALDRLPALRNHRAEVSEEPYGGAVTFLHTIVPGGADRSYGINVAQLAGIPDAVLDRAAAILSDLDRTKPLAATAAPVQQLVLPLAATHPVVEELRSLTVDSMTPLEALQKLVDWQRKAGHAP
ncbi:MAG TPA: DNA mismatch repair protein MutS [Candidatus Dormibacteraeota bacterium]|nr:DNA mismatch repair protein MutS [Candidatus Dormibacteraeota bacterium]